MELARSIGTPGGGITGGGGPTIFVNDQGNSGAFKQSSKLDMLPPRHTATPLLKNHPQRRLVMDANASDQRRGTMDIAMHSLGTGGQNGGHAGGIRDSMSISSMLIGPDKHSLNGISFDKSAIGRATALNNFVQQQTSGSYELANSSTKLYTPQKFTAQIRDTSGAKIHPIHLVQQAAFRAKLRSEEKVDRITRLELQKETLKHIQQKHAQDVFCIDAPRTRAQEENDRVAFMNKSNIKNNILVQYGNEGTSPKMSLQPHKFNTTGWTYKQIQDVKLRSNFMDDHLNGRYCNRGLSSKKDTENYKPSKIFTSMYQKAYHSRNIGETDTGDKVLRESADGPKVMSYTMGMRSAPRANMFDVMGSGQGQIRGISASDSKNDYSPDFVTTLNFNFNTNDVFGAKIKKSAANSTLKKSQNGLTIKDPFAAGQKTFDGPRPHVNSFLSLKESLTEQAQSRTKALNTHINSSTNIDDELRQRRDMNNQILKNQYSFWAGMYVKRLNSGAMINGTSNATLPGNQTPTLGERRGSSSDMYDATQIKAGADPSFMPVPFGDPRSMTQCLNFNRKKPPHLPEQEIKSGGGVRPLGIPQRYEKSKKPPKTNGEKAKKIKI